MKTRKWFLSDEHNYSPESYPHGMGKTLRCDTGDGDSWCVARMENAPEELTNEILVACQALPALLKLLERVEMFNRGVAEDVELSGVAQEAREAVRNALT